MDNVWFYPIQQLAELPIDLFMPIAIS